MFRRRVEICENQKNRWVGGTESNQSLSVLLDWQKIKRKFSDITYGRNEIFHLVKQMNSRNCDVDS